MPDHRIGTREEWDAARGATREEWDAARGELLAREKELTHMSDELARQRRELPWVPVGKEYTFQTADGPKTLAPAPRRTGGGCADLALQARHRRRVLHWDSHGT
jgi:hypothetical protein